MRRQIKKTDSPILKNNWKYVSKLDKDNIRETLLNEQHHICAYIETYLGERFDSKDIEHFNPTFKGTENDGYENWFLVNHQLNLEKGSIVRWEEHQPILHPTDIDFESRIIYDNGDYIFNTGDIEAEKLIKYLKLDDPLLTIQRKNYINYHKEDIEELGMTPQIYFDRLLKRKPHQVYFIRAIEEAFGVKLNL